MIVDQICFCNREFIQILIRGTACLDKLKAMKNIYYVHHTFYNMEGMSKVGDEQFVSAKKLVGYSQ
jgi:hypothetical protein